MSERFTEVPIPLEQRQTSRPSDEDEVRYQLSRIDLDDEELGQELKAALLIQLEGATESSKHLDALNLIDFMVTKTGFSIRPAAGQRGEQLAAPRSLHEAQASLQAELETLEYVRNEKIDTQDAHDQSIGRGVDELITTYRQLRERTRCITTIEEFAALQQEIDAFRKTVTSR